MYIFFTRQRPLSEIFKVYDYNQKELKMPNSPLLCGMG